MRQSALDRGLPGLALDLLIKRAIETIRQFGKRPALFCIEHGLELAIPGIEPEVPDDPRHGKHGRGRRRNRATVTAPHPFGVGASPPLARNISLAVALTVGNAPRHVGA